jgi:hypothetical protein
MAIVPHLVEKVADPGDTVIDGIEAVVIAIDDTQETSAALIQQAAVDKVNAELGSGKLPDGYFTSNRAIGATFDADDDVVVFSGKKVLEAIA